jgi:aspartyl-tRNA(Asn)/glutamyl-tRNA(Gln) amidotransferase subunit B
MSYIIESESGDWKMVIGLEVHAKITSEAKLFSGAATAFGARPNSQVSLVDAAMPGMLPVINEHCVAQAVRTGLGLGAKINLRSVFERKNYFYPDLPQGYQISQFQHPIVGEGIIQIETGDGQTRPIGIERLHMEQDAGKSLHDQDPARSFVDLNRSGVALMEIVSKPDLRSPEEAGAYMRKLRSILRYLETCDGNMEEGSLRCDANVSVRHEGEELRTRCEIKNLNSVRFVMAAIAHEAQRQVDLYEDGGEVVQETRLYDQERDETRSMRSKEEAHDYRYFPDPDLLPLVITEEFVGAIKDDLPELPDAKEARLQKDFGLAPADAALLAAERTTGDYFETVARGRDAKLAANWVIHELSGLLNKAGLGIEESPVDADALGQLVGLIGDGTLSGRMAKEVFEEMWETGAAPGDIVAAKGLAQISDSDELSTIVADLVAANPDEAEGYRSGNQKLIGWFVGQVMKATGGKANPKLVNELLRETLEKS